MLQTETLLEKCKGQRRAGMQIPRGRLGPKHVPVVNGPSEAEENVESVRESKIRVFLMIENRLLRDTLAHLLRRQRDVELSGMAGSRETNPEEVVNRGCDVALFDFVDPEWIAVVRKKSQEKGRAIKIILIGMDTERAPLLEAVRCGVTGYLLKDASVADVTAAVRAVARGEASCPPQICTLLFQTVAQMKRNKQVNKSTEKMGLTLRQQKLMKLVAKGLTNKEIAEELHLSEYTVKNHMFRILKQLDAESRSEAVETLRECGHEMNL
jgi:DNA-binding NarL/FixJ family response regulator